MSSTATYFEQIVEDATGPVTRVGTYVCESRTVRLLRLTRSSL